MAKINSRSKGAKGELEFAKLLTKAGFGARRGQQYEGSSNSADVVSILDPYLHFEVKRHERHTPFERWYWKAVDDAGSNTPVVAHRRNNQPWRCTLAFADLWKLALQPTRYDLDYSPIVMTHDFSDSPFHVLAVQHKSLRASELFARVSDTAPPAKHPVLVHRRTSGGLWLATVHVDDFIEILHAHNVEEWGVPLLFEAYTTEAESSYAVKS